MHDLLTLSCKHYSNEDTKLTETEITNFLTKVTGWQLSQADTTLITKDFKFKNYHQTIEFINAVAWIVHQQNHHPEITITYNTCHIEFSTHSIKGLSLNDFICAAKINTLES